MELRNLKYLSSLASEGSFTAAAKANYITQPAISIQLKKLQEELGIRLFETRGKKVAFTEAGVAVLDYADRFIRLEKQLLEHVRDMQGLRKGSLSIGTIDAAAIYILPEVFTEFREKYPGIEINLEIASTMPLMKDLREGALDVVCGTLPIEHEGDLDIFRIFSEELVFITPPGHPLAGATGIDPKELSEYSFISFQSESVTRRIIEKALTENGAIVNVAMAIDSQEAIKHLVSSGLGLSVLPLRTVKGEIDSGALDTIEVKGVDLKREIGLILPAGRYLPVTVRAFHGVLKAVLGVEIPPRYRLEEKEDR